MDGEKMVEELARISYQCAADYSTPLTGYKYAPFEISSHKDVHRMVARAVALRVIEECAKICDSRSERTKYSSEYEKGRCDAARDDAEELRSLAASIGGSHG